METNNRNLTRDEVIQAVSKTHGDSHLLDLLKRMPDGWHLRTIASVIPSRHLTIFVNCLGLIENDQFATAEESLYNLTETAKAKRESVEKDVLADMTLRIPARPLDGFSAEEYDTETRRLEDKYAAELVQLVDDWIDGEDIGEWDEEADDDWMDEEDDFDDEDLFDDDEDEYDEDDEEAETFDRRADARDEESATDDEHDAHKDDTANG